MHTIKRILTSTILAIGLATLASGPALADQSSVVVLNTSTPNTVATSSGWVTMSGSTWTVTEWTPPAAWGFGFAGFLEANFDVLLAATSSNTTTCSCGVVISGSSTYDGTAVAGQIAAVWAAGGGPWLSCHAHGLWQLLAGAPYTVVAQVAANGPTGSTCGVTGGSISYRLSAP